MHDKQKKSDGKIFCEGLRKVPPFIFIGIKKGNVICYECGLEDAKKKVDGSLMYAKEDRMRTASRSFFFFLSFLKMVAL